MRKMVVAALAGVIVAAGCGTGSTQAEPPLAINMTDGETATTTETDLEIVAAADEPDAVLAAVEHGATLI